MSEDVVRFSRRAAEEMDRATRAATTEAVRAHCRLSELYLDAIERLERWGIEAASAAAAAAT